MRRVLKGLLLLAPLAPWLMFSCARAATVAEAPVVVVSAPPEPEAPATEAADGDASPAVPSSAPAPPPALPTSAGVLPGYRIDPAALVGCRAPDEPGCGMCCDRSRTRCVRLSGLEDWSQYPEVEPWYNSSSVNCPENCPPCARCTERSEHELAAQLPFRCDCDKVQIGVDPCFTAGCECECSRRQRLLTVCPAAPP